MHCTSTLVDESQLGVLPDDHALCLKCLCRLTHLKISVLSTGLQLGVLPDDQACSLPQMLVQTNTLKDFRAFNWVAAWSPSRRPFSLPQMLLQTNTLKKFPSFQLGCSLESFQTTMLSVSSGCTGQIVTERYTC